MPTQREKEVRAHEPLRVGVAGLGRAFMAMAPSLLGHPDVKVVAAADPVDAVRERFAKDFGLPVHGSVAGLCDDPDVDAVYIATPHQFHADHVRLAAEAGKHVLLEKPMALTLDDCDAVIEAVEAAGVVLVVGHTHGFNPPILRTRDLVAAGTYGRLRMMNLWTFTDFLYRPRRPEELDTARGGGIVFNQLPHQVDIVRYVSGARMRSVRAVLGSWDERRRTEGACVASFEFDDGVFGSMVYSGYAHFDTSEFNGGIGEGGDVVDPERYGGARRLLATVAEPEREAALKISTGYGGENARSLRLGYRPPYHQNFGVLIASCDRADLRPHAQGIEVYGDERQASLPVEFGRGGTARAMVLDELVDAVRGVRAPLHDGRWGKATLEVCLALLESARTRQDVALRHQ